MSAAGIGGLSASGCAELMRTLNPGKPCPRATAPSLQAKGLYMRARVCFYVVCACACAHACVCLGGGKRPSLIAASPNIAEKYNKAPKKATVRWPHVWPTIVLSLPYRASQLALVTRQTSLSDSPPCAFSSLARRRRRKRGKQRLQRQRRRRRPRLLLRVRQRRRLPPRKRQPRRRRRRKEAARRGKRRMQRVQKRKKARRRSPGVLCTVVRHASVQGNTSTQVPRYVVTIPCSAR